MNEDRPLADGSSTDTTSGPRVLSLHPTTSCAVECAPCYLKRIEYQFEKPLSFFLDLVAQAGRSDTIRQVAVATNIDPEGSSHNLAALQGIVAAAARHNLKVSATTNYENVCEWGAHAFSGCHLVTISIDEYKFPSLKLPSDFFKQVTRLQAEGCVVNLNVLLSGSLLSALTLPRLRRWLGIADQVYLLVAKHFALDFSRDDLLQFFERLSPLWQEPDRFFHLQVDNCIKPQVFPWNQLCPTCEWGESTVNVHPDGSLSYCAMDTPFARIDDAREFTPLVRRSYARHRTGRSVCPYIEFLDG